MPTGRVGAAERAESAVVLVVLDGVRWQDVFAGADPALARACGFSAGAWTSAPALMPNLHRLIEKEGIALGASRGHPDISASGPHFISLPGYEEIFSGRPDPTCDSNDCPGPSMPTVADDVASSSGPSEVAVVASWPTIARAASSGGPAFLVSSGRRLLENGGVLAADPEARSLLADAARSGALPGEGDYRPDTLTAALALRVLSLARPRFLFVGLGDADEHAHRGNYRGYLEALRASDAFLGALDDTLRATGARGQHTTILVTTDHGRAYDFTDHGPQFPESSRVWLVAALAARRPYTLSNVAPTVRALLGMGTESGQVIGEIAGR
jgi:hypothetical protein